MGGARKLPTKHAKYAIGTKFTPSFVPFVLFVGKLSL